MKTKIGVAILAAVCVGLLVALIVTRNQGDEQQKKDADTILDFSNQLTTANINLDEFRQVNLVLSNDLSTSRQETVAVSNNFVQVSNSLEAAKASLESAQEQITNLDSKVAALEDQNQLLDQHSADMANIITNLSKQITDTQIKLVTSETNNAFLEEELKKQVAEKAEWQRKFNDLATVRVQVKKLRDDALTARRMEWMREGIDPAKITKGGEILMQHNSSATSTAVENAAPAPKTQSDNDRIPPPLGPNFNLNVEVGSDGSVHVIPATPVTTNPPAQ